MLGGADELLRNFLLVLVDKGRADRLPEIGEELERLVAEHEGIVHAELTTAVELADDEAAKLLGQIEQASGRKVEASRTVDPELIGGVVLQGGSPRLAAGRAGGRRVEASRPVARGLTGGMVLRGGSPRLDASVRGRLDRLRRELVTR